MCGIAGKLNFSGAPVDQELLQRMCDAIAHRGPDDQGFYRAGPIALGSRRLSIIDLAGGHQPIGNEKDTVWIVFNGEIYNFPELARHLQERGHHLKTRTDTEVIVHLYEDYDIDCLQHLNGMFAFALWDAPKRRLLLARDRLGKKPLFYALSDSSLTFASEIAGLLQDQIIPRELNLPALDLYLRLLYVPAPLTMFKAVRKLPPGHYLLCEDGRLTVKQYWDVQFEPKRRITWGEAVEQVRTLLEDAVRCRLISDVPLGAFLSGGIDSSTIVALMSHLTGRPVRTFSIGFEGFEDEVRNDLPYAHSVVERYGTQHQELIVRPNVADILPKLVRHYGEPFGDGSAVPTYYVSQLARTEVKVALSGEGGDEVFGGYDWYRYALAATPWQQVNPYLAQGYNRFISELSQLRIRRALGTVKGAAVGVISLTRLARDPLGRYSHLHCWFPEMVRRELYTPDFWQVLNAPANGLPHDGLGDGVGTWQPLDQIFYLDHKFYLPGDILTKTDISSMANSLEVRCPFLDYRLVEFSASLPPEMKVERGQTKRLLREAVVEWVPEPILTRKKMGFGPPMDKWMREGLFTVAEDLLLGRRIRERGLFDVTTIARLLQQHHSGESSVGYQLWLLVIFEMWCQMFLDQVPQPAVPR